MWHGLLSDARLYAFLHECDLDLADAARVGGCVECGGAVHRANYERRPRGGPAGLGAEYGERFSFCCGREGCRKRLTPPSLRFLGRKVYLGVIVVLVTAMRHGPTPARITELQAACGASERTIARWRQWWHDAFAESPFWQAAAASFSPPVERGRLPASMLERFGGGAREQLQALLRFISPITTCSAADAVGF